MKRITDLFVCEPDCPRCLGTGYVCEDHPDFPWEPVHPMGCACGAAGMPCKRRESSRAAISILVPSRGRPNNLARLVYSLAETTAGDWEALVRIDEDDPERDGYAQVAAVDARVVVHEGPRGVLSGYWNELAGSAAGEILMMGADDLVFRTPKWDGIICDAFPPDRLALVHGDDLGDRGKTFATHGFVHRRWVEVTGQFVPPIFVADYADRWLNDVANIIDRREFRAVTIEHLHPGFGKAPLDRTYRETSDRARASDMALLYARTSRDRLRAAGRLLDAIEGR